MEEKKIFLRVYESRNKFRFLINKQPQQKNKIIRNLSLCVIQNYSGYAVVKVEKKNQGKQLFKPIDIVYDPVQNFYYIVDYYFTFHLHVAYCLQYSKGKKGTEILHAFQCYSCYKFHSTKTGFEKHFQCCSQISGVVYKFDNTCSVSYEDIFKFMGDLRFVVYFDFETTTGSDLFLDKKMYVISYCSIFAFHPKLKMDRIVIYRSFQQTQDELFHLSHLKEKMLQYVDPITLDQGKDAAINVFEKKSSFALSEMFSVELKFTIDALLKWSYTNYKLRFVEIDTLTK